MIFAFLDEFGHIGPYYGRQHPTHNTSPVFGLAGLLLPEASIRPFSTFFLHQKEHLLGFDIEKSGKPSYEWEKKGANLFTAKSIERYPNIRSSMFRIINRVKSCGGRVFYYGREKIRDTENLNANGFYTTIFAHAIRQIDDYCNMINQNYILIVDEHSARKALLETAAKTMFGQEPARRLLSPPFEVESYLNQNIQAADWTAAIIARLWNYRLDQNGFSQYKPYEDYFWERIHSASTHSTVMQRNRNRRMAPKGRVGGLGEAFLAAQQVKMKMTYTKITISSGEDDSEPET